MRQEIALDSENLKISTSYTESSSYTKGTFISCDDKSLSEDVILTAELGKALLDRTRSLEQSLEHYISDNFEKNLEIKHLRQQLSELRESNRKNRAFVDETDCRNLELECLNLQLLQESALNKEKLQRLTTLVVSLEQQVEDLTDHLSHCICSEGRNVKSKSNSPNSVPWVSPSHRSSEVSSPPSGRQTSNSKGAFIDDELSDQPRLSTCELHGVSSESDSLRMRFRQRRHSVNWPLVSLNQVGGDALSVLSSDTMGRCSDSQRNSLGQSNRPPSGAHDQLTAIETSASNKPPSASTRTAVHGLYREEDLEALQSMVDDASFLKQLEAVYDLKLNYHVPCDYEPRYKQLFNEAFSLLRSLKSKGYRHN